MKEESKISLGGGGIFPPGLSRMSSEILFSSAVN